MHAAPCVNQLSLKVILVADVKLGKTRANESQLILFFFLWMKKWHECFKPIIDLREVQSTAFSGTAT